MGQPARTAAAREPEGCVGSQDIGECGAEGAAERTEALKAGGMPSAQRGDTRAVQVVQLLTGQAKCEEAPSDAPSAPSKILQLVEPPPRTR